MHLDPYADPAALAQLIRSAQPEQGTTAVLIPEGVRSIFAAGDEPLLRDLAATNPDTANPLMLLEVRAAKGLEFDVVIVVDPQAILDASARGANDLYVALTRATTRVVVVHPGELPSVLSRLSRRPAA